MRSAFHVPHGRRSDRRVFGADALTIIDQPVYGSNYEKGSAGLTLLRIFESQGTTCIAAWICPFWA